MRQKDFELTLSLATNHPELFEVAHEYEFAIFKKRFSVCLVREKPGSSC
jgi:hypothetical protein